MTIYLTPQQILFIHARLIAETGGEHGLRDIGLLESAVARSMATFDGQDLYPTMFAKAAALMESLVVNHAFVDGNKRVAITAAALFLWRKGYRIVADNAELERFTRQVVLARPSLDVIAGWFLAKTTVAR